jgi:hypothetical protein
MIWTRLVYGTAILAALTGTAIFYGNDRAVVKAVDIIELSEATNERLMPFGYKLATNTIYFKQLKWIADGSNTNRWTSGNGMNGSQQAYLKYDGYTQQSNSFINVEGIANSNSVDSWYANNAWEGDEGYLDLVSWAEWVFLPEGHVFAENGWIVDLQTTGMTWIVWEGATNIVPAYVFDVKPARSVGYRNSKSTLDAIDAALLSVIPSYADHEKAVNGNFTNNTSTIPMLTVSSVWTRLDLPYVWTNISKTADVAFTNWVDTWTNDTGSITNVDRIGTNAVWNISTNISTNYTFTTGPICTTNMLNERHKVASYLKWTVMPAPVWTNVTEYYGTNLVWPATNWTEFAEDGPIGYQWRMVAPGLTEPNYPAWWNYSLSNGPPGAWWAPAQTPLIDDAVSLTDTKTNGLSALYPSKTFTTSGSYSKFQVGGWAWWGWPWYNTFIYNFKHGESIGGTNTLTVRKPCPAVKMPYNIGGITVTGDVYVSINSSPLYQFPGLTNIISAKILTADMTAPSSNSFWWIGDPMEITNDLFTATNYPMSGGYQGPFEYWWGYDQADGGAYVFSSASWGTSWGSTRTQYYQGKRVILKWSFSRCKP